jgi:hypothetical protein
MFSNSRDAEVAQTENSYWLGGSPYAMKENIWKFINKIF